MKNASEQDYDGWVVLITCDEAPPKDHEPGRPMVYSLRGVAKCDRPYQFQSVCDNKSRIEIPGPNEPPLYFFDCNRGFEHIRAAFKDIIDKRKKPA